MSDYGDDDSDGGDWLFVEEEYIVADDLAEHAVQSPPPTAYDTDRLEEWDRFDYFNDIEYASDGYDDANFVPHRAGQPLPSATRKRKPAAIPSHANKKQRPLKREEELKESQLVNSPVVWRSQASRGKEAKLLPENAESYALLKDWRESLPTPAPPVRDEESIDLSRGDNDEEDCEDEEEGQGAALDPAAVMAALQSRLASAGGPMSSIDPQQLLQFAMRMAMDQEAGDDIAGEALDEILDQDEQEDGEHAEASLLSWISQQRNEAGQQNGKPLPTPLASDAIQNSQSMDGYLPDGNSPMIPKQNTTLMASPTSHKRKADNSTESQKATKRRSTQSHDAPTAASWARTISASNRHRGRPKR